MKNTAVRLTTEQLRELDRIGLRDDRSTAWLIRRAIDLFIEDSKTLESPPPEHERVPGGLKTRMTAKKHEERRK